MFGDYGQLNQGAKNRTRTATGIASGIAAIIVFVGAFLLAPQAGYAQEVPECDGDEETIITATGIKSTTCNWDLDDAPINEEAVGLAPSNNIHTLCGCEYTTENIPVKEFSKYGIKTINCAKVDTANNKNTTLQARTGKLTVPGNLTSSAVTSNGFGDNEDLCLLSLTKGRFKSRSIIVQNLSEAAIDVCRADIEAYDAANLGGNCP